MKVDVKDLENKVVKSVDLPSQFDEQIRFDIIKRAVLSIQANNRQPYGADPAAGMKHSAKLSRRRRNYKTSYGFGISRVPRKILSRNGTRMNWVGAQAPGTVGGREAHPPKATKLWEQKINTKERKKAIRSALAASVSNHYVTQRGHKLPQGYPFIVVDALEALTKTSEVLAGLQQLGFEAELARCAVKRIRAGKGKSRGRKYKRTVGPLLVVSGTCALSKSARNIAGVQVCPVSTLSTELLAPGCAPGRLVVFSEKALQVMQDKKLFM
ncbi:MAG: 50S ribosomal protein L4 [Candidatus Woesearchaeota archaeon]